ncbi:hypothetical protein [Streptomyces sp. ODS28]|uniref:hypothetical protein n=1 Tax=Streptomyces sp. ODS28 TaxID=3136688 RepID=UPI0031E9919B
MDTTPNTPLEFPEPAPAPPAPLPLPDPEARGCLFALSQPPLMLFLAVIAVLLAVTGAHDLLFL